MSQLQFDIFDNIKRHIDENNAHLRKENLKSKDEKYIFCKQSAIMN